MNEMPGFDPDEDDEEGEEEETLLPKDFDAHRDLLLRSVASQSFDTLELKVAWVLNNFPEARDSDVALAIRYWEIFDKEHFDGRSIDPGALFKLTRIPSLIRSRAKIQNSYRLFQASPVVRKRRGKLSKEEKKKAIDTQPSFPSISVYADESGKTENIVVVASIWILNGFESYRITDQINQFKVENEVEGELHFKDMRREDVEKFTGLIDVLAAHASAIGFKFITVKRAGAGHIQSILEKLYYLLLKRGVEHESSTGRTPLPRILQVWKDMENLDADKLLLADIKDKLTTASIAEMGGMLKFDEFTPIGSEKVLLLQVADILAASVSRAYNHPTQNPTNPKDVVAHYVLNKLGIPLDPESNEYFGDMTVKLNIL
jgi:hypothetical protein